MARSRRMQVEITVRIGDEAALAFAGRLFAETGPERSLSCGVALATPDITTPGELLRAADVAQYEQKRFRKGLPPLIELGNDLDRRRNRGRN